MQRGPGTRRGIIAAGFADNCHNNDRKQVTQELEDPEKIPPVINPGLPGVLSL